MCKNRLKNRMIKFDDYGSTDFKISLRKGGWLRISSSIYGCSQEIETDDGRTGRDVNHFPIVLMNFGKLINAYNKHSEGISCSFELKV